MASDEFEDIYFHCIQFWMSWEIEVGSQGLGEIGLGDVTKMFNQPLFKFSFGLTYIE